MTGNLESVVERLKKSFAEKREKPEEHKTFWKAIGCAYTLAGAAGTGFTVYLQSRYALGLASGISYAANASNLLLGIDMILVTSGRRGLCDYRKMIASKIKKAASKKQPSEQTAQEVRYELFNDSQRTERWVTDTLVKSGGKEPISVDGYFKHFYTRDTPEAVARAISNLGFAEDYRLAVSGSNDELRAFSATGDTWEKIRGTGCYTYNNLLMLTNHITKPAETQLLSWLPHNIAKRLPQIVAKRQVSVTDVTFLADVNAKQSSGRVLDYNGIKNYFK